MSELWNSFLSHKGRTVWKWPNYFPVYEKHFSRFKNTSCTILEIGCGQGGSLQLWKKFFGPNVQVVGIDIKPECKAWEEDQIKVFIGDQSNVKFLEQVINEVGAPDMILDDGSHYQPHVHASFDYLYPQVSKNGVYMIEDLHCAYKPECCGIGPKGENFIERAKSLVDSVNCPHSKVPPDSFNKSTNSIVFYENIIVFEKGIKLALPSVKIGQDYPGWKY
jgi:cephalosporin hydroxylase